MLAVPPAILDRLHLGAGSAVGIEVDGERLVLDPKLKPRYTLEELLLQCDPDAPFTEEDRSWNDVPAVGREL